MSSDTKAPDRQPQGTRSKRGPWEWVWRADALASARSAVANLPELEQTRLHRARVAAECADRALDPVDPPRAGSALPLAISLYREAAYWALLGQDEGRQASDLREAFAVTPKETLEFAAAGEDGLHRVRRALVEKTFVETAGDETGEQEHDGRAAQAFVRALLEMKIGPAERVGALLLQRWVRFLVLLALLLGSAAGAVFSIREATLPPDLAAGKPWRTSSTYAGLNTKTGICDGLTTRIFFHTNEEKNAFVEIDLGKPTRFTSVELVNRQDCCPDRAIPVAIEVSADQHKWKEVARRSDTFSAWRSRFEPVSARYVRARTLKRTFFHLERVSVRSFD